MHSRKYNVMPYDDSKPAPPRTKKSHISYPLDLGLYVRETNLTNISGKRRLLEKNLSKVFLLRKVALFLAKAA